MAENAQNRFFTQTPGGEVSEYYPVFISMAPQKSPADDIHVKVTPRPVLPHMVTIKELAIECKEKGISITEHFIRQLCIEGKICHVKAGSKYLINYDRFIDFLNGEADSAEDKPRKESSTIHPVPANLKWNKKDRS